MKKYLFLLFILLTPLVYPQSEIRFDSATVAYNQGDYEKAIGYYMEILEEVCRRTGALLNGRTLSVALFGSRVEIRLPEVEFRVPGSG